MYVNFNILNQLGSPAINSNTFANRPPASYVGRLFVSIDTFELYRDNGTSWDLIGGPGSSTVTGTGTPTQVAFWNGTSSLSSSVDLYWDNVNTRLGIGTTTPTAKLDIHGNNTLALFTGGSNSYIGFAKSNTTQYTIGYTDGSNDYFGINDTEQGKLVLSIDGISRFVGVNYQYSGPTDKPLYTFDVYGQGRFTDLLNLTKTNTSSNSLNIETGTGGIIYKASTGYISVGSFGTNRLSVVFTDNSNYIASFDGSSLTANRIYTLPDQTGTLLTSASLSGYVPTSTTLTINGTTYDLSANRSWSVGTVTSVTGTSPISSSGGATPAISISQANGTTNGYLSSTDWTTFNSKQSAITLTTTGSSGAATFVSNTLNVPNYTLAGLGGVPTSRTLTINGTTYDLSADRSWTIASNPGTVTSITAGTGLTGGTITSSGTIALDTTYTNNLYYAINTINQTTTYVPIFDFPGTPFAQRLINSPMSFDSSAGNQMTISNYNNAYAFVPFPTTLLQGTFVFDDTGKVFTTGLPYTINTGFQSDGYVPKFVNTGTMGQMLFNSLISDNGTTVAIDVPSTMVSTAKLQVGGTIQTGDVIMSGTNYGACQFQISAVQGSGATRYVIFDFGGGNTFQLFF